jgi:protein-disulfide isomerase
LEPYLNLKKPAGRDDQNHQRSGSKLLGAIAVLALLVAATVAHAAPQTAPAAHPIAHKAPATTSITAPVKVYGTKGAPITMEVFTDYECPICRVFFEQTLRYVINDYVAAGKVYIIHHDFPLVMHPYSGQAARWANASATVGEFGAAEAALYDNQNSWTVDGSMAKYIAQSMPSSDFQRVEAIMRNCTTPAPQVTTPDVDPLAKSGHACPVDPYIAQDIQLGYKDAVNATPTYIITYKGQRLPAGSSAVSWPILKQFFDSLLSQ